MIRFARHRLDNGLTLLHHYDGATRMVAVNLLYRVGSADETVPQTGLAHLLEHLMFTGSRHAPNFDNELQAAGGQSNAWTSVDATNFYDDLPAQNLDTALWLERDRLLNLTLDQQSVDTQKSVVIEEFKQIALNVPYGDLSHLMGRLAYTVHPYQWPPVGRTIEDIQAVSASDIRRFHCGHYAVNNLILSISGNVTEQDALNAAVRWFGDISPSPVTRPQRPAEPKQRQARRQEVHRDVPHSVIYRVYHTAGRSHKQHRCCDLISDILGNGQSSRFYRNLILPGKLFTQLDASVTSTLDCGLFAVRATLADGASADQALKAIDDEVGRLLEQGVSEYELGKYVNKHISTNRFEGVGYLAQAMRLCSYEQQGDAELINTEEQLYRQLTTDDIMQAAREVITPDNSSTLLYLAN